MRSAEHSLIFAALLMTERNSADHVAHLLRCGKRLAATTAAAQEHKRASLKNSRCKRGSHMDRLVTYIKSLARREEGQDLLEYALLVALIAIVAVTAVTAAGGKVDAIFTQIAGNI